jgi:ketosteroid isomerase-like protein
MTNNEIKALEQQALALDELRCKVLLAKDGPGLAALLDEGLTYTHASGRRDTKDTYVDSVATQRVQYLQLDREEVTARVIGTAIIVEGKVKMKISSAGAEKSLHNRYLAVWTTTSGKPLLTAWASTKLE